MHSLALQTLEWQTSAGQTFAGRTISGSDLRTYLVSPSQLEETSGDLRTKSRAGLVRPRRWQTNLTEKMIPLTNAFVTKDDPATVKLLDVLKGLEAAGTGDRLPVLTSDQKPRHVIHRSTIDRFIAKSATAGATKDELENLTLEDLLADPDLKDMLATTVAVVPEAATLADAKRAMEALKWCQDVMITPAGSSTRTGQRMGHQRDHRVLLPGGPSLHQDDPPRRSSRYSRAAGQAEAG